MSTADAPSPELSEAEQNGRLLANALESALLASKDMDINIKNALDILKRDKCDVNQTSKTGKKPLNLAIWLRNSNLIGQILEKGADINGQDSNKNTPLHSAMANNNEKLARYLLERGADFNAQNSDNYTPFNWAVGMDNTFLALDWLEKGAVVTSAPIHSAVRNRNMRLLDALLEKRTDINGQDGDKNTALHLAVRNVLDVVDESKYYSGKKGRMKRSDPPNVKDPNSLIYHTIQNNVELALALLEKGADPNVQDKNGDTPLHLAVMSDNDVLVRALIAHGADVNVQNNVENTPLHLAVMNNSEVIVHELVTHGADVNMRNEMANKPAHMNPHANYLVANALASFGGATYGGQRTIEGPWTKRQQESHDKAIEEKSRE